MVDIMWDEIIVKVYSMYPKLPENSLPEYAKSEFQFKYSEEGWRLNSWPWLYALDTIK